MNIIVDMAMYKKNSKKHPVHTVPEVKIKILQDIPKIHVSHGHTKAEMDLIFNLNCL